MGIERQRAPHARGVDSRRLRLAAKYPGTYRAVSGHSSITNVQQLAGHLAEPIPVNVLAAAATEYDCGYWLIKNAGRLPAVRFDCGRDDALLAPNRVLHQRLVAAGIVHTYEEFAGGHDWSYWSEHVADTFRFFARALSTVAR